MKTVPLGIAGLAAASIYLISLNSAHAQDGDPQPIVSRALSATIDYGNDNVFSPEKHNTDFDRYGLDPGQTISITVWFPPEMAGQSILAEALDGGLVTVPDGGLIVAADGTVTFPFQASEIIGGCRIAVHQPDDSNFLQFWIVDSQYPENNPPNLPGVY